MALRDYMDIGRRYASRYARKAARLIEARGYHRHGANTYKKSVRGWITRAGTAKDDIDGALGGSAGLRARSRDLYMSAPLAAGALKAIRTNEIGAGLRCKPSIDAEYLGLTPEQAADWENATRREFERYSNSKAIDAARRLNFGQIQALARLSEAMNGDCFALPVRKDFPGDIYSTKIKLLEADSVATPGTLQVGKQVGKKDIREGIELDADDQAVRYYIVKRRLDGIATDYETIEAYGAETGRPNIIHVIEPERIGQVRGVPMLSTVLELSKHFARYFGAEVDAAVACSMIAAAITSDIGEPRLESPLAEDDQIDKRSDDTIEMASGAILELNSGEDIKLLNPTRPNPEVGNFLKIFVQLMGAATEVPSEVILKQFTASYSASRGALLEAWKRFRAKRSWFASDFCQPIYEEWLFEAVSIGRIDAPGFFGDAATMQAWSGAEWPGPAQGQLDPEKEAKAAKLRIDEELSTREKEAAELTGTDWEYNHRQRALEESRRRADGLIGKEDKEEKDIPGEAQDE